MRDQPSVAITVLLSVFVVVAMVRAAAVERALVAAPTVDLRSLTVQRSGEAGDQTVGNDRPATEEAVRAIATAYPERVDRYELRDGDWALLVGERWFYWSEGRLLPDEMREYSEDFTAMGFYGYTVGEHQPPEISEEFEAAMRKRAAEGNGEPMWLSTGRHQEFYEALYEFNNAPEADRTVQSTTFLGRRTRVHPMIVEPLISVETDIRAAMQEDPQVRKFVDNISSVSGFHWREILGSISRSYHAYGTAVDLLPHRYDGFGYWRWAQQSGIQEWWALPPDRRHSVPDAVVDAFEHHGFVWGGKWIGFDPVHFEYRPEVIQYAEMRLENPSLPALY